MWKPQGMYADFMLYQPTIFFGEAAIRGLSTFPGARIAIISSSSLDEKIKELLLAVFKKKSLFFIERSWVGEPDIDSISGSVAELEKVQPDVIIAIGGGSVIDGTKLCRLFYEFPYFKVGETKLNQLAFKTRFVAIPTTLGSGAEASSAAVYIDKIEGRKEMIVSHDFQPTVVILNPEYVSNAPEKIIVSSALDAMGHVIEGYISRKENTLTDIYAEKALNILFEELSKKNRDYLRLQYAGYLGGIVQNHCLVGAAHAIAHQLSVYGYSHGEAVALLLANTIRINCRDENVANKMYKFCKNAGIENIDKLLELIDVEVKSIMLDEKKDDLCILFKKLVKDDSFINNVLKDKGGRGNPIPITKEYLEDFVGGFGNGL